MIVVDTHEFHWQFKSSCVAKGNQLEIDATEKSDYFIDPASGKKSINAPFLYTEIVGDFTVNAKVSTEFKEVYDACTLLFWDHEQLWGKLCFEYTDIGANAVVSVVTQGTSDDANGQSITTSHVWLQISRQGQLFSMHYSLNGRDYRMVRYFSLPCSEKLKVGFSAQSPLGNGGTAKFKEITIRNSSLTDMRAGS